LNLPVNTNKDLRRKLIIDIDDTCVDTISALVKWLHSLNRLGSANNNNILENREYLGKWLGIPEELADLWINEFLSQSWQWGALYPCLSSQIVLPSLHQQGWYIIGYSRAANNINRAILRRANLELIFPNVFRELVVVDKAANLYPLVKEHENAVCVTATESTARVSVAAGHATFLIDQPWNRDVVDLTIRRFKNWDEINKVLMQMPV